MMKQTKLFRQEVIDNKKNNHYGSVFINTPVQYTLITSGVGCVLILLGLFLMLGEYTEKFIVNGYLNSSKGIAGVYSAKNGVIIKSYVHLGQAVKQGDPLLKVDTSLEGWYANKNAQSLIHLKKRKNFIKKEIAYKRHEYKILKPLLLKKFISVSAYHKKHDDIIMLENNLSLIETEIIKFQQDNSYVVHCPVDGTIASINYKKGQYINATKPLLKILPDKAELLVEMFVPVRQSGFLNKTNAVLIRYDAYPSERFGTYKASIQEISLSVMSDEEEEKPIHIGQPYYKVTATLESQFVILYGRKKHLQHGMSVTAVILGSKRKIWQWMLDPIYSFYGERTL